MCSNNNCIQQCNCTQPCNCACSCSPEPCIEGCLTDTKTDCTFLSQDLDICSEVLPKGSTVTEALAKLGEAVCDGITVTVQDMKVKVDANDTTSGYLFDKLTVCDNLTKTVTNVNGNETLRLCNKIDNVTAGNILTSGVNGLYVPTPTPTGYNLSSLFSSTVNLTIASVLGGQTIKADAKISPNAGNMLVDSGGLYVPTPTVATPITLSRLNTNSINTTLTLLGSNYEISSNLKIDPSSTAPISITSQGLKVDCCIPVTPANTPISIVLGSTAGIAMTATGIDNHTLTPSVVISPSAGNALTATTNGLYCPAPGAAAATTINDTTTVDATLISPSVYTLAVKKSTDSCNALINGTDGALYVNGVNIPYGLNFVLDGTDLFFEFQGPSTTDTDYEVEIQGTTGSPQAWIPIAHDSTSGVILRYDCGIASTVISNTVIGRVRYKCGANYSEWSSLTYVQEHTYISESGTISITPGSSGTVGEFTFDVDCTDCLVPTNFGLNYTALGNNYIKVTCTAPPANVVGYAYTFTVNTVEAGSGIIPAVTGVHKLFSAVQLVTNDDVSFSVAAICKGGCQSAFAAPIVNSSITVTNGNGWTNEWIAIPGGWYANGAVAGASGAFYKITKDGEMKFRGTVDLGSCTPTAYGYPTGGYSTATINFLNVDALIYAALSANTLSSGNLDAFSLSVSGVVNATTNAFGRFVSRSGNAFTAVFTTANSAATVATGILIPLGGIKID